MVLPSDKNNESITAPDHLWGPAHWFLLPHVAGVARMSVTSFALMEESVHVPTDA